MSGYGAKDIENYRLAFVAATGEEVEVRHRLGSFEIVNGGLTTRHCLGELRAMTRRLEARVHG